MTLTEFEANRRLTRAREIILTLIESKQGELSRLEEERIAASAYVVAMQEALTIVDPENKP